MLRNYLSCTERLKLKIMDLNMMYPNKKVTYNYNVLCDLHQTIIMRTRHRTKENRTESEVLKVIQRHSNK